MGGRDNVFGCYPGIEFRLPGSAKVVGEADVVVVLRNGALILGECKAAARGLRQEQLERKLWAVADKVGARATFVATLDRAANCGPEWRVQSAPNGRPHFALTAEHLFELDCQGPYIGQDLFDWRDDYTLGPDLEPQDREGLLNTKFSEHVARIGEDFEQQYRAPWMTRDDE